MKKILLPILSLILAACSSSQVAVTRSAQVTVTSSPPPTATPIPTPTLHPQFVALQAQISASGERFTLLPNGTIQDGAKTVPGLVVDKSGAITLQGQSSQVTINPEDVSFDDEKGVSVKGYTLDEATGLWRVEVTSLSIENLDAKKWGNYSLIENPDGYYEMKDVQENLIPEVKLFRDGTAELTYSSKKLAVAFQAVSVGAEGQLSFGLWDFKNGEWSMAPGYTAEDVRAGEFANDYHKLVVIRGNDEIEKKLTDTIFMARDLYMNNTEGYRPESEFENISVTVNFKTIDNFDPRPEKWMFINESTIAIYKGQFSFYPKSAEEGVVYQDYATLEYARPMQVVLDGAGWFKVKIINSDGNAQAPIIHVPVVVMDTDGSLMNASAFLRQGDLSKIAHLLTREERGKLWFRLHTQAHKDPYSLDDLELATFVAEVNSGFCQAIRCPSKNEVLYISELPNEFSTVIFTLKAKSENYKQ